MSGIGVARGDNGGEVVLGVAAVIQQPTCPDSIESVGRHTTLHTVKVDQAVFPFRQVPIRIAGHPFVSFRLTQSVPEGP